MVRKPARQLFLIAPRGTDALWPRKRSAIRRICRELGWKLIIPSYRANNPSYSAKREIAHIRQSSLVVADLSFERPSCYFELGLAEALGRPVALIARTGTPLHQTSYRHRVRYYDALKDYRTTVRSILEDG